MEALPLGRVTGGRSAAKRLAFNDHAQFLNAVQTGGMDAVCATEHFSAMIAANPINRETLMGMDVATFTAAMQRWLAGFSKDSGYPFAGITPAEMRTVTLPAIVVPPNDRVHPPAADQAAHRLLANSRYQDIMTNDVDQDVDFEGRAVRTGTLAAAFINFLRGCERYRGPTGDPPEAAT